MNARYLASPARAAVLALALLACSDPAGVERLPDISQPTDGSVLDVAGLDTLTPPPTTCASDAECDDGHACTLDRCELGAASPHCVWSVAPGACFIHNVCRAPGEVRPDDPCARCAPTEAATAWSPFAAGEPCEDHDACTLGTTCGPVGCEPAEALACDDAEACTEDRCDAALGCVHVPAVGLSCDDGLACTRGDVCGGGVCAGAPDPCDDGDPCTDDACDEAAGGCTHTANTAPCDDGDPCTTGDSCGGGVCGPGAKNACDDENSCTIDSCHAEVGCVHLPTLSPCCIGAVAACDDGNACTEDLCDPLSGACATAWREGVDCDDRDACTVGDVCAAGACGGADRDCDDGDPCTADSCSSSEGCVHAPLTGPACDDGLACSTGDACVLGACEADTSACVCEPDLAADGVKFTAIAIGAGGYVGEGLDLDLDPSTCAPASSCEGGVDNALGILASFANDPLGEAVAAGDLVLLAGFEPAAAPAGVSVSIFTGQRAPASASCDVQAAVCDWWVDRDLLDPETCAPRVVLTGTLEGNLLTASGAAALPFEIRLSADAVIAVTVSRLRLVATVTRAGGQIVGLEGVLGGAVPKQALIAGVNALPDGALPPNLSKATVLALLQTLVQDDIDLSGDGVPDAASIGIVLGGRDAYLVGATPP